MKIHDDDDFKTLYFTQIHVYLKISIIFIYAVIMKRRNMSEHFRINNEFPNNSFRIKNNRMSTAQARRQK